MASEEFLRSCCMRAVAQHCQQVGFTLGSEAALNALVDVSVKYIQELGHRTRCYAEHAGRPEANVLDVLRVFSDLGITIHDLLMYLDRTQGTITPLDVPHFPIPAESHVVFDAAPSPARSHIPEFLPEFPESYTYKKTEVATDDAKREDRLVRLRMEQKRVSERSLASLRLALGQRPYHSYEEQVYMSVSNPFTKPADTSPSPSPSSSLTMTIRLSDNKTAAQSISLKPSDSFVTEAYYARESEKMRMEDKKHVREKRKRQAMIEPVGEAARRMAKIERILALKHMGGFDIVETEHALAKKSLSDSPMPSPSPMASAE